MSKNVVISGYYGFGNFGDETILHILTDKLKSLGLNVTVFSKNPKLTAGAFSVDSINTFDYLAVCKTIKSSDILISGGGSLLQDVTSIKSLIYYLGVIFTALFFRKKVIVFAQGIGPINNKLLSAITLCMLKHCDYVSVRDEKSYEFLNENHVNAELLCDPIFSLAVPSSISHGAVGIQLRDFKTVNEKFLVMLAKQVLKEFPKQKIEILSLQKSIDYSLSVKFESILKSIDNDSQIEIVEDNIIERIAKLEYLIGMRFHALLTAIMAGVKCCAINYDIKVEKLAHSASIPLISLTSEKFDNAFADMKNLKAETLSAYACSNHFDWSGIEKILRAE